MNLLVIRLNNLRGKLLGIEMELSIIEQDITEVNEQLAYLEIIQSDLIYNLEFLQRPEVVAVIMSYNQSITQLKEVQSRILKYRSTKISLENKMEKYEKIQDSCYEDIEAIYCSMEKDKKILLFRKREYND